jgi:hypothetical protein
LGKKKPQVTPISRTTLRVCLSEVVLQVVDMPLRWHGAAGHFTKEFEMNVPGAKAVEVNQYRCRSLNVIQTKSKVRYVQSALLIDAVSDVQQVHSSLDLPY